MKRNVKLRRRLRSSAAALAILTTTGLLAGCGDPAGTPCQITGSGFTAAHNCATQCLSRWTVTCAGGENIQPPVCAGRMGCAPGSCPQGQLCYHFDDPFEDRSYCVPDTICGSAPTAAGGRAWEVAAAQRAAASRAEMDERRRRREEAIRQGQPATSTEAQPVPGN